MKHKIYLIAVFVGIMLFMPTYSAMAGIVNSDFTQGDDGLDGWTHNEFVEAWNPGAVWFMPDTYDTIHDATMSQVFTLDPGSTWLSFDGSIGDFSETGVFTAALLDSGGGSLAGFPDPFFSISSDEVIYGKYLDFTCSLDVSSLSGQEVKLVFNLNNDYLDTTDPSVILSNLTIVPEPATMALLGLGGLLLRRKRRA